LLLLLLPQLLLLHQQDLTSLLRMLLVRLK
jgi:hypothetical protein